MASERPRQGKPSIVRRIGVDGISEVYLTDDTRLGRKVALKFIQSQV